MDVWGGEGQSRRDRDNSNGNGRGSSHDRRDDRRFKNRDGDYPRGDDDGRVMQGGRADAAVQGGRRWEEDT